MYCADVGASFLCSIGSIRVARLEVALQFLPSQRLVLWMPLQLAADTPWCKLFVRLLPEVLQLCCINIGVI